MVTEKRLNVTSHAIVYLNHKTYRNKQTLPKQDMQILQAQQHGALAKASYDPFSQSLRIETISELTAVVIITVFLGRACR
jgi:hypothetical protein